jgi:uncharacterized membrane protein YozB (DUF420 family)
MPSPGFLGTGAPLSADITLAIEIAMGLALVLGMMLACRQRYRAHAWCQSTVVVLNLIVIAQVMLPAFRNQVAPKIPARLVRPYYSVATVHATMGCIAELLGLYIILVAGTRILPKRLRFVRYKPWMRTELVIWWLALLLGLTTYVRWYIAPQRNSRTATGGTLTTTSVRALYEIEKVQGLKSWRNRRNLLAF